MKVVGTSPPDAVVVGGGLVGLSTAVALAETGLRILIISGEQPGTASLAAAGMLSPLLDRSSPPSAHAFALAARDRYPDYVDWVAQQTGERVHLSRAGILELAFDESAAESLRAVAVRGANRGIGRQTWLAPSDVATLEPELAPVIGALHHEPDGWVDHRALYHALTELVDAHPRISRVRALAVAIEPAADRVSVLAEDGARYTAGIAVLAAGAWVRGIAGVPTQLPVEPVRGQMLAYAGTPARHVCFAAERYFVPRSDGRTFVGSTMERVGFDPSTTDAGQAGLEEAAGRFCPALRQAPVVERWAGLRPITPDLLPIIGRDPEYPALVYACGHSRDGILLAPLTADCVAALARGAPSPLDISAFNPQRFAGQVRKNAITF